MNFEIIFQKHKILDKLNPSFLTEIQSLHKEGNEILSIIVASIKTARKNQRKK